MIRLAVRVRRDQAELVLAELLELVPAGAEEVEIDEDTVEYAVYGAPGELPTLPSMRALAREALIEVSTTELADDWSERWRRYHRPVLVDAALPGQAGSGGALHVRPPWEPASERPGAIELVIDPGQAFGTGAHATTRMCLELLLQLALSVGPGARRSLLDVGCGSGVLAIAAAKLGFDEVLAIDLEPESVAATVANARFNSVALRAARVDLRAEALPGFAAAGEQGPTGAAPMVITANLVLPTLLELARVLPAAPPHLIASGLLAGESDELAARLFEDHGLCERRRLERDGWEAVWMVGEVGSG
jgi:ribosomal protein L11 methyltransferase